MSYEVWNGPIDKVTIANGGTTSGTFSMPDEALGVVMFVPQLTASTSIKIQGIVPKDGDRDSDVAVDLSTLGTQGVAGAITAYTLSGLGSGSAATAYGFDAGFLGAGVFQIVANGAQSSGAVTITLHWRTDRQRH